MTLLIRCIAKIFPGTFPKPLAFFIFFVLVIGQGAWSHTSIRNFYPAEGNAGILVNIDGSNFRAVERVSIGGVPAVSFTIVDNGTIHAVAGHGTNGNVSVWTITDSATAPGFTFIAAPLFIGYFIHLSMEQKESMLLFTHEVWFTGLLRNLIVSTTGRRYSQWISFTSLFYPAIAQVTIFSSNNRHR